MARLFQDLVPTVNHARCCSLFLGAAHLAALAFGLLLPTQAVPAAAQDTVPERPTEGNPQSNRLIRSIAVIGTDRLEPNTVLSYVRLRVGDVYTPVAADAALKDLAATELFSASTILFENGVLTIRLTENPIINRILLEGNERIKPDKILPEIKLGPRQIFTRSKVRADVARIIELYKRQGRFGAIVEPKMVLLPQNRVDIVFEISEGPKSKIHKINIIGNETFTDDALLKEMVTKEARAKNFMSSNTSYDPDRLAFDQQKLRQFYLVNGYADFRVVSAVAELTPDQRDFIVTYVIEEGKRYQFGKVGAEVQLRDLDEAALEAGLSIRPGDWYDAKRVEDTVEQLTELAARFGYAFADVSPRFKRNPDTLTMDVEFILRDTPRAYVERVEINGNTLTQDKVIRREFRLFEGDAFNSLSVLRSAARIRSLGFFQENFEIRQTEGSSKDRIILEANVEERPTGELQFSAGFSSVESIIGTASIRQRNFRGMGQTIGFSVNISNVNQSAQISFAEPYLWDRNISFGMDVYQRNFDDQAQRGGESSFVQSTTGATMRVGIPVTEYAALIGTYTFNYEDVSLDENTYFADLDGDGEDTCEPLLAGRYLCDAVGQRTQSILGLNYRFSNLDNNFRPTRGRRLTLSSEFAGLGGDTSFARFRGQASQFWNIGSGFVLSANLEGGYIHSFDDEETRLTDRFFLGDPQMRGFRIRGVGPAINRIQLVTDENGDEEDGTATREGLGGNAYYLGRLEFEIPLASGARELGLRPSLFVDAGSVFGLSQPALSESDYPDGEFIATRDDEGRALYSQTYDVNGDGIAETVSTISPFAPDGRENSPLGSSIPPFREEFVGNTWRPRMSAGVSVNWNSPFGPFRVDLAIPILRQDSDETRVFSFNVGTQF